MNLIRAPMVSREPTIGSEDLRKIIALVCAIAGTSAICAERRPKAIESGLYERASVIEGDAVASIYPAKHSRIRDSRGWNKVYRFTYTETGSTGCSRPFRRHSYAPRIGTTRNGDRSAPAWVYNGNFDDTAVVNGQDLFVEIQCGDNCPPDLPFDICG